MYSGCRINVELSECREVCSYGYRVSGSLGAGRGSVIMCCKCLNNRFGKSGILYMLYGAYNEGDMV